MDTLDEDAATLIEQLAGINKVHFVGLNRGGFVGMRLAARNPHVLKTLTLLGTFLILNQINSISTADTIFKLGGASLMINKIIRILFGKPSLADASKRETIFFWKSVIQNYPSSIMKEVEVVIQRQGIECELEKIETLTLVRVGEEDIATIPTRS